LPGGAGIGGRVTGALPRPPRGPTWPKSQPKALHCSVRRATSLRSRDQRGELAVPECVFVDEFGDPYHPPQLTRYLHALQRRAGLPEITVHDLRHTAATVALLAGMHPKVVSERQGHASTQITLDCCSQVLESMQVAAADAIGHFLQPE